MQRAYPYTNRRITMLSTWMWDTALGRWSKRLRELAAKQIDTRFSIESVITVNRATLMSALNSRYRAVVNNYAHVASFAVHQSSSAKRHSATMFRANRLLRMTQRILSLTRIDWSLEQSKHSQSPKMH